MANPQPTPPKRYTLGYLMCKKCKRTVPYQGLVDGPNDNVSEWPQHRCKGDIRPFSVWTKENPIDPLPPPSAEMLAAMRQPVPSRPRSGVKRSTG